MRLATARTRPFDPLQRRGPRAARHRRRPVRRTAAPRRIAIPGGERRRVDRFSASLAQVAARFARASRAGRESGAPPWRRLWARARAVAATDGTSRLTFSGVSMLDPRLFEGCDAGQLCAEAAAGSRARGATPDRPALRRRLARRRHARAACGARCRASARQGETPRALVAGRLKCASRERGTHDKWLISKAFPSRLEPRPAKSGEKFVTPQGFTAIRDGIKKTAGALPFAPGQKPRWLRAPLAAGSALRDAAADRARASPQHGLRRSALPEHRRVLERRHRDARC